MRVLYVATSYPADNSDWRGVFIKHLAFALAEREDIELSMWTPPGPTPPHANSISTPPENLWLRQLMHSGGIAHTMRSGGAGALLQPIRLLRFLRKLFEREQDIDLYHLNWLQTAIPLPGKGQPALITVLGTDLKLLGVPLVRQSLRRVMRKRAVTICPNAEWMVGPLRSAFGDLATIEAVPFGIDPVWFELERAPDHDNPKWLVVTRLTRDKLGPLFEWSRPLFEGSNRQLHLIGPMQEALPVPAWVHYHGSASPEQLAQRFFPTAHGLITLSEHAEGRPQVMLEAMAARLPIIASDMPAHAGIVEDHATGFLCNNVSAYASALAQLEEPPVNQQFGETSRTWVKTEIGTWTDCAQRYVNLYTQLKARACA